MRVSEAVTSRKSVRAFLDKPVDKQKLLRLIPETIERTSLGRVVEGARINLEVDAQTQAIVETVGPGGMFGEMSLVGPAPRSASAVARSDATLVPVDSRRFQYR